MNNMVLWIFAKIMTHLTNHEGCTGLDTTRTSNEIRATVQDSLGFRYEIQVKCVGRIQTLEKEIL